MRKRLTNDEIKRIVVSSYAKLLSSGEIIQLIEDAYSNGYEDGQRDLADEIADSAQFSAMEITA